MRKHRNQHEIYEVKINDQNYKFVYRRNFYGFRGKEFTFIIYTGINDSVLGQDLKYDLTFGIKNYRKILDYISNNSIFVELLNKIIWRYSKSVQIKYEINNSDNIYENNFIYINYDRAKKVHSAYKLMNKYPILYQRYSERLNNITKQAYKFNSKIIFITQVKYHQNKGQIKYQI